MPITRRLFAGLAFGAPLAAVPAGAREPLVLEDFFRHPTRGSGSFVSDLAGVRRDLTVDTTGRWDGRTLILTERIAYGDGERETAVWRFDKTGADSYDGQRTKVGGVVPVRVSDGAVRMGYVAEVAGSDGRPFKLRFDDVLERTDARTVVNTARVSYLGLTVGRVEITFKRTG